METTISFTSAELVAICAGILTLIALAEKIAKAVKAMQKPNEDQNARLDAIDEKLDRDNKRLNRHDDELAELRHGSKTLQRGVYELLGNAIDGGNNKDAMKEARDALKKDVFGE